MPATPKLNSFDDKWLRIFGINVVSAISIASCDYFHREDSSKVVFKTFVVFVFVASVWHLMRSIVLYFKQRYPADDQIGRRFLLALLTGSFTGILVIWLERIIQHWIASIQIYRAYVTGSFRFHELTWLFTHLGVDFALAVPSFIFFQTVYETMFFINEHKLYKIRRQWSDRKMEKLRAANLQSQLDALKQQVNPHFLFNNFNALDSLIEDDAPRARVFLEELSNVYRYLLRSNEYHLIALSSEMDFIRSYYHLLKTRLGEGLRMTLEIDQKYASFKLPPLTIQLLVENAFMHNIVLPEQPLMIHISTDATGHLVVRNNVQRKRSVIVSNGLGLNNMLKKYRILDREVPVISEQDGQFVISIPLIESQD